MVASKFGVNVIYIEKQFCLRTLRVLEFAFEMNAQIKLGLNFPFLFDI